jgi:hypothetical protein
LKCGLPEDFESRPKFVGAETPVIWLTRCGTFAGAPRLRALEIQSMPLPRRTTVLDLMHGLVVRRSVGLRSTNDPNIRRRSVDACDAGRQLSGHGWQMNTDTMGVYGDYYLKRAIVASIFLGANQPEDAVYPLIVTDADGKPPTGNRNYVLHFSKEELPPVDAFWSLTMYDAEGFPIANSLKRFSLGDRDALKYNADGSLDLCIQRDDPSGDRTANWLPSPSTGSLGQTMRLCAPKAAVLNGSTQNSANVKLRLHQARKWANVAIDPHRTFRSFAQLERVKAAAAIAAAPSRARSLVLSSIAAIASSRPACAAFFTRCATRRTHRDQRLTLTVRHRRRFPANFRVPISGLFYGNMARLQGLRKTAAFSIFD